ncbi:RTX-III toxin determinant A from serotype 2 [Nymphon striatum]|nr:RTX-III toxin determinant A from serotype 2 [Nymphon striatum]
MPAVVAGDVSGAVDEDAGVSASGTLTASDVDNTDDAFQAASGTATYGTFSVDAGGVWSYTLDDANATVDALNVGDSLSDSFDVLSEDGTVQSVAITINGANDAAVVAGDVSGAVDEDAGVSASGTLTASDVDNTDDAFQAASGTATYGTFSVDAGGVWSYTLDDANATVDALNVGDSLSDSFDVLSEDGTVQSVAITINGANDAPIAQDPVKVGSVTEESIFSGTIGSIDIPISDFAEDVDSILTAGSLSFTGASLDGTSLSLAEAGFSYDALTGAFVLSATTAAYQYLDDTEVASLELFYTVSDGSASDTGTYTVSIEGMTDILVGGAGDDTLTGTVADDLMQGNAGNDQITGNEGADTIEGGNDGADTLNGGDSNDLLIGGADNDVLNGQKQQDTILGGTGDDTLNGADGGDDLNGEDGDDLLNGGTGSDTLQGGDGNDSLYGQNQNDTLLGANGNDYLAWWYRGADTLIGSTGNDTLNGGDSNDYLEGGADDDILRGQAQQDTIDGGFGNDTLFGGSGGDTFIFKDDHGVDEIVGFDSSNAEQIDLSSVTDIVDFADLVANHLVDAGGTAMIVNGANSITLTGVSFADVGVGLAYSDDDFIF